jgi:hypothetical protein
MKPMILTPDNLHHYLLENGLLELRSLVDGSYTASQSRTRNTTFSVTCREGKNLFIKQLTSFDPQNTYILQKDATCLWLIKHEPAFAALSAFVPDYFGYDTANQVLITEFLPEARNMETFFRMEDADIRNYMDTFAQILASFHFPLTKTLKELPSMRFFQKQLPWALTFGMPDSSQQSGNSPVINMVLGNPDYKAMLRDARQLYEFKTLIHGDIKWMNFLISGKGNDEIIRLIDWEIADIGDPLWDVGGLFMSVIMLHVTDSPYQNKKSEKLPTDRLFEAMEPCWPAISRFWNAYIALNPTGIGDPAAALNKALHFAGARLIQTAVEFNMHSAQLNPNTDRILQACVNLFMHRPVIIQKTLGTAPVNI